MAVVGVAGALAATSAVTMSIIASRRNDGRAVWIDMAFSVIATMLVMHGLATPGVIAPANGLVQVAGALNLPVCGVILAASGLPVLRRPSRVKLLLTIQLSVVGRSPPPEPRHRQLALSGLVHDAGKLSVPNEILGKPGRLTDAEFHEIRRHPAAGRELLAELGGFSPLVLELVESHHERIDGNGYPNRRLAGELDLAVRILTVADVYDALTADRVYREAWPAGRALALLDEETGVAFDAESVTALRSVVAPERPELHPAPSRPEPDTVPARGLPGAIFGEAAA